MHNLASPSPRFHLTSSNFASGIRTMFPRRTTERMETNAPFMPPSGTRSVHKVPVYQFRFQVAWFQRTTFQQGNAGFSVDNVNDKGEPLEWGPPWYVSNSNVPTAGSPAIPPLGKAVRPDRLMQLPLDTISPRIFPLQGFRRSTVLILPKVRAWPNQTC